MHTALRDHFACIRACMAGRRYRSRHALANMLAIVFISCLTALPGIARADACGPPAGGPPSACTSSVASLGSSDAPDAAAGNPINVITGNKYQREEDLPALPGVLGLEIVRHYNSAYSKPGLPNGPMGRAWNLSYETELFDRFGSIQVLQADGSRITFQRDPRHPNLCSTQLPANGRMTLGRLSNGEVEYDWTWPNGRRLHFNAMGKLKRIAAPSGEAVELHYDNANLLVRVVDPQGRSLDLRYLDRNQARANDRFRGVQYIDSPVGRFAYEYGSALPKGSELLDARILLANLVRVRLPTSYFPDRKAHALTGRGATTSAVSRRYHHDDPRFPWLLTGISIESAGADGKPVATRFATFGYDDNGRANLSMHADNVDKVTIERREGGRTMLTNSLGQRTVYRYAIVGGAYRMLEVRGAGCATCGEINVRYGYDGLGQLLETTRLDTDGAPVSAMRRELDKSGRTVKVSRIDYRNGQPGPAQWQFRLAYQGDDAAPSVIARPSVVPGKERVTRIAYNSAGQPVSVTETGWVPTYDGLQAAAPVERSIAYGYTVINGRSLLTRIDGPLPNGKTGSPLDSDVTLFEYDRRPDADNARTLAAAPGKLGRYDERDQGGGLLTRIVAPGNLVTEVLERDDALRPSSLHMTDGDLVRVATIRSNWRGAVEQMTLAAGTMRRHFQYEYNADGQIHTMTQPGRLRTRFQYDRAGRASRVIFPDGSGMALAHDTEDRAVGIARHGDMRDMRDMPPAAAQALSSIRFEYDQSVDQPSRLSAIADTLGLLNSYRYNDAGQVAAIANALGTTTTFGHDADGLINSRTDAAGSADAALLRLAHDSTGQTTRLTAANGVATVRRYDDFGRKVFEADPDRGVTLFRHDAGGRLLARIDETRSATRYTYDHAGRLLAVGKDALPDLLQYRYRGRLLTGMISSTDGKPEHAAERLDYQYDAMGQLLRETRWLADAGMPAGATDAANATTGLLFVTQYAYDEAGRLVRQTLPDGHRLGYRFTPADDAAGQRPGARHRPGQLEAILFDERVVVADIDHTIAGGLAGYTMSNGARQQITLDRRGRVEQLRTLSNVAGLDAGWWRRIAAWFSSTTDAGRTVLYSQHNRYDAADRLMQIERQLAAPDGRASATTRREDYRYDRMNRLTGIVSNDAMETHFRYDQAGNRVAESGTPARTDTPATPSERRYNYVQGGNWLTGATEAATDNATAVAALRDAWLYHPSGLPLVQLRWQAQQKGGATHRRTVYNSDKRPVAVYDNDQLIARYHYNSLGERIAKTLYRARPKRVAVSLSTDIDTAQGDSTYSLYRHQRLAAETDSRGRITAHYVYLYGKPVAKIEMADNTSLVHRLWKRLTLRTRDDASDRRGRIYAIVPDHLGTPQEVLDERQQVVWQAATAPFGQARVLHAASGANGKPFQMNLRLPGQVYDAETGLHYNYLRDYDPALGRYLAPDPMGLGGGINPYVYVSNNPLTNTDPLGLYQSDIHYYMTFFLAVAAGVTPYEARVIALATQNVDDDDDTRPLNLDTGLSEAHAARLLTYHFTMVPSHVDPATGLVSGSAVMGEPLHYGTPTTSPAYANIPENAQLQRLYAAVTTAGKASNLTNARCTQLQFLGEYLHAFEDTFAHRDSNNIPFALSQGFGHGLYGSNPDYTYNHVSLILSPGHFIWDNNEKRTLQAEREVFAKLTEWGDPSKAVNFADIEKTLKDFNGIRQSEGSGETTEERQLGYTKKIQLLQTALDGLSDKNIDITKSSEYGFQTRQADDNRKNYLRDENGKYLDQKSYSGTIIPK